jgi:hypothetical protein
MSPEVFRTNPDARLLLAASHMGTLAFRPASRNSLLVLLLLCMAAAIQVRSWCPAQEQLARHFRTLLDRYHLEFLSRMECLGIEEASRQTQSELKACLVAREALQAHSKEHLCDYSRG